MSTNKVAPKVGGRVLTTAHGAGTVLSVSTGRYSTLLEVKLDNGDVYFGPAHKLTYLGSER